VWLTISIISLSINIIFLLYIRWLLKGVTIMNTDIEDIQVLIGDFSDHLSVVNEMEMFYGDETIAGLMEHSKKLKEVLSSIDLLIEEVPSELENEENNE
jgi:hypothetical protein